MNKYDLLIIYNDGTMHVVKMVSDYSLDKEIQCFVYVKNGYRSFVPVQAVWFFGRRFDYESVG